MNAHISTQPTLEISQKTLLAPYALDEMHLARALSQIMTHQVDYADLYFQTTRHESWGLEEGIVKAGSFNIEQGFGVRAVAEDRTAFAYSDNISYESLNQAAQTVRAIAKTTDQQIQIVTQHAPTTHSLYTFDDPLLSIPAHEKVKLLERVEQLARAMDPRVKQVMVNLSGQFEIIYIARHDGLFVADIRPLVHLSISVVAQQNHRTEMGAAGGGGRVDYRYFDETRLHEYAQQAVHTAITNLDARPAPAGNMTVVLGAGWPGILLHEAIGHGLEGDFNRKGSSAFTNRIGQQVAAKGVTVVDDGTLAHRRGSLNIDDEGTPTQCTTLIEDGILTGYLQDTMNARLMKQKVTGNARRESYASTPMPRMTNTYMLNGQYEPEEIIASVKKGLYAVNFSGGQVDITNGKFVFSASEAYLIEDGKITHPVKGATLIGNGPESLKYVSMIGNNLNLDSGVGTCGKEGQGVPVGVGQPTLKIDQITVGGTV